MEEIIHAFGVDWRLIAIQVFNFSLMLAGLWYFLYTPVLKLLDDRKKIIEEGLTNAAHAERALRHADKEKAAILAAAHAEALHVDARAKVHAEEKIATLIQDAEEKAARILHNAEEEGAALKMRLEREGEADIARVALLAAEKILRERSES